MRKLKIISYIYLILIAVWNGFVVLWGTSEGEQSNIANKIWHRIGWFIRAIPVALVLYYMYPDAIEMFRYGSIALFLCHALYNAIINIINGNDLLYLGTVAETDGILANVYHWIVIVEILMIIASWII